jgi:polyhydroxybutyrate depolymerase
LITPIWILYFVVFSLFLFIGLFYFFNRTNGTVHSGGRIRRYLFYVPAAYDPDRPSPLVVCYHGFVQWPAHQQRMSGWNRLADQYGFLVVYPKGSDFPLRWNAHLSTHNPAGTKRDLDFFSDLLEHLCQSYTIDRSRVYVNGMSNGAGLSHLLAGWFGNRVAAMGGVAGAYLYPRESIASCPRIPVIAFHGTEDPVVPYHGGRSGRHGIPVQFPAIEDWAADWAAHNGCAATPDLDELTPHISRISYLGCEEGSEVVLYKIKGSGHTWPGGKKLPVWLTGTTNQEINASEIMWDFFKEHALE